MADDTPPQADARALETAIARDIHSGVLAPGSWLKQIALQERYGRSRGDVRRALDKLVAQRLVQQVRNFGYRVRGLEDSWLDELRQVRLILESAAAAMMTAPAGPAEIARLRALAEAFSQAVARGSILQQNETNLAFHSALLELCPNRELARMIAETRLRMPAAPLTQWSQPGWIEESARHHHAMVDALEAGDHPAFSAVVRAHIRAPRRPEPPPQAPARTRRRAVTAASSAD